MRYLFYFLILSSLGCSHSSALAFQQIEQVTSDCKEAEKSKNTEDTASKKDTSLSPEQKATILSKAWLPVLVGAGFLGTTLVPLITVTVLRLRMKTEVKN